MSEQQSQQSNTPFSPLSSVLKHLEALVSFDTQNPPRNIQSDSDIFAYFKQHLPGFSLQILDAGDGCLSLLATRGKPEILFNFHIDTVPVAKGWTSDPFELQVTETTATGLGACDIKGAAACMLSAVNQCDGAIALLFSSDEEHGNSAAVKQFLATEHGFDKVIVAEPTQAQAIFAHRGIQSARALFFGESGHASQARAITDSAIHKATHWCSDAVNWVKSQSFQFETLTGLPFNIGKIDGGIKANMIAAQCEIAFGFRPLPGQDSTQLLNLIFDYAKQQSAINDADCQLIEGFKGPTLPAANQDFDEAIEKAKALANQYSLPFGNPVNFWTEASLFSQSGLTALVYGPGNIEQAHTANEWVSLAQLAEVEQSYLNILAKQI
ncbi:acetylornithine deacetylase [Aliikangiella maris]|uniref:Acetylornithine deacetylase n=2 Tax=Aliikangiella maris TaxID=3162458 RepID=A0ABV3MHV1_9GAMM